MLTLQQLAMFKLAAFINQTTNTEQFEFEQIIFESSGLVFVNLNHHSSTYHLRVEVDDIGRVADGVIQFGHYYG